MSDNNQQVHWGPITSISVREIPPQTTGKYLGLFQEVSLRLENTPPTEALRVPIDDPKVLAGAYSALKKMFIGQKVAVFKRAGALFLYNTIAQHSGPHAGHRGPRKSQSIEETGNGHKNGRRLPISDASEMSFDEEL